MKALATKIGTSIILGISIFLGLTQATLAGDDIPEPRPTAIPESNNNNVLLALGALGMGLALKQKIAASKNTESDRK